MELNAANSTSGIYQRALDVGSYTLTLKYNYNNGSNYSYGFASDIVLEAYDSKDDAEATMADYITAKPVIAQIDAIGTVTLEKRAQIALARSAYNALTIAQKAFVTNYTTLKRTEQTLAELEEASSGGSGNKGTVTVQFRLIGSTLCEDEDGVDLSVGLEGFHGVEYQTWIKTTCYTMEKGTTL